jgi:Tol biopolymer transport system component
MSLLLVLVASVSSYGQETYFGKNKVRYKSFEWDYIQSRHFDVYFYENAFETAKFAAEVLESSYEEVSQELNYLIQKRIPVFIYNSHNDFQQTNIITALLTEGTGGFTERFKNRVVTPFDGSYENFRHVLHHELTHAITFDMLYGGAFSSLVSRQRLFSMPLWLAEGFAEYSSRHGWDYFSDMWVRDATINGYLLPFEYLNGYNAYREGQAIIKYIADKYGDDKVSQIFKKGKVFLSIGKAVKKTLGIDQEQLWKDFSKEMKRRYWPEIAARDEIEETARKLTDASKDGSYMNEKPVFNPEGDKIAMFTDRSDHTELVLISVDDGRIIKKVVKGSRSGDIESLHSYVSGMSFSPDGRQLVFVAKSHGKESLFFHDLYKDKITLKKSFDYYNLVSPAWSPDGSMVAFSALEGHMRDIFVYHIEDDRVEQITEDRFDDGDPSWYPDSRRLLITSDRTHPDQVTVLVDEHPYVTAPEAFMPGDFDYGSYGLFIIDIPTREISPVHVGPGQNSGGVVSPDGGRIAFISNRNGIDNVYIAYPDSGEVFAVTNILTAVTYLSWSPEGDALALQAFNKGMFDVFVLDKFVPAGDNGVLPLTAFFRGEYDREFTPVIETEVASIDSQDLKTVDSADGVTEDTLVTVSEDFVEAMEETEPDSTALAATDGAMDDDSLAVAPTADSTLVDSALAATEETAAADTTEAALGRTDSTAVVTVDSSVVTDSVKTDEDDDVADTTGIYDDEFVYVSPPQEDPLAPYMEDISDDSLEFVSPIPMTEPESFDSIPLPEEGEDYKIYPYKVKFTPDYVGGGFAYDTFFGMRGQTMFIFSDYLGNHTIAISAYLVNTIDQSNIQAFYFNSEHRLGYGAGLFHSKNFRLDNRDFLFSDRYYGVRFFASRPFSTFERIELTVSQTFIDREYYDRPFDDRPNRSSKVTTGNLAWVADNVLWGMTGPVNGRRAKVSLSGGTSLFDSEDIDFYAAEFDYRKYWHLGGAYSVAFRAAGGGSDGRTPKLYFLGGTTNWIGNRTLDAEAYDVENLYFADVVTPLRGVDYYSLSGNRYGLINMEFRFPLIDYFLMRFPLRIALTRIGGVIFTDMGAAWNDGNFKGGTSEGGHSRLENIKTGFGFGMRANLGFFLLRYDLAWGTDFYRVNDKPNYYFSMGADF